MSQSVSTFHQIATRYIIIEIYTKMYIWCFFIEEDLGSDHFLDGGFFKDATSQFVILGSLSNSLGALSHGQITIVDV